MSHKVKFNVSGNFNPIYVQILAVLSLIANSSFLPVQILEGDWGLQSF